MGLSYCACCGKVSNASSDTCSAICASILATRRAEAHRFREAVTLRPMQVRDMLPSERLDMMLQDRVSTAILDRALEAEPPLTEYHFGTDIPREVQSMSMPDDDDDRPGWKMTIILCAIVVAFSLLAWLVFG
jgi:hypothetical protein